MELLENLRYDQEKVDFNPCESKNYIFTCDSNKFLCSSKFDTASIICSNIK